MADLNRKMAEGHTVSDLDTVIDEVYGARGEYDTLGDRLDEIDTVIDTAKLGIHYKGEVDYYSNLPTTGVSIGDAYTVKYSGSSGTTPDGTEYVWGTVSGTNQWINFSKDSYTKAEVDALLALKQNALTTAQLAAVNSGIDSTKVAQIESNKNNISSAYGGIVGKNKIYPHDIIDTFDNDITYIINPDNTITFRGIATYNRFMYFTFTVPETGNYMLTGCPSNGGGSTYYQQIREAVTVSTNINDSGNGRLVTLSANTTYYLTILIISGVNMTDVTFSPMICTKKDYDASPTYQPHVMSNAELTAAIQALQAQLANQ